MYFSPFPYTDTHPPLASYTINASGQQDRLRQFSQQSEENPFAPRPCAVAPVVRRGHYNSRLVLKPWRVDGIAIHAALQNTQQLEQVFPEGHLQRTSATQIKSLSVAGCFFSTTIGQVITGKPETHENFRTVSTKSAKFSWLQ